MKKITLLFILCLTITTLSYAQCTTDTGGFWPGSVVTATNDGSVKTIATNNFPNAEKSGIGGLTIGNTYTVTGTNTTSVYITVAETTATFGTTGTVLTHGDATVTFMATTTEVLIFWHLDSLCTTQASDNTLTTIQCTSVVCSCTETAIPACTTLISPTDLEMSAATTLATNGSRQVALSWTAVTGASSYDVAFNGTVLGNTPNANVNITGLAYDETNTWSIIPVNCFGDATGCNTWSFTTEMDPALSVEEFDSITALSVYPNPANDIVNIKTDLTIDSIEVINMLGQTVKTINGKTITNNAIDISTLGNGVYFLNISAEGKSQSIRIIKE